MKLDAHRHETPHDSRTEAAFTALIVGTDGIYPKKRPHGHASFIRHHAKRIL